MRGDYVRKDVTGNNRQGSPPLARGLPNHVCFVNYTYRITPACAGTTVIVMCLSSIVKDHPRLCGDYLIRFLVEIPQLGSPPLVRGLLFLIVASSPLTRITPACAGTTIFSPFFFSSFQDHPRLCGDYPAVKFTKTIIQGSPPLVRGLRYCLLFGLPQFGITPACAGTTCQYRTGRQRIWDHPRLRGDYLIRFLVEIPQLGSPPLARGLLYFFS